MTTTAVRCIRDGTAHDFVIVFGLCSPQDTQKFLYEMYIHSSNERSHSAHMLHKELRSKCMYMTPTKGVISHIYYRATQGPRGESWKVINTFEDRM